MLLKHFQAWLFLEWERCYYVTLHPLLPKLLLTSFLAHLSLTPWRKFVSLQTTILLCDTRFFWRFLLKKSTSGLLCQWARIVMVYSILNRGTGPWNFLKIIELCFQHCLSSLVNSSVHCFSDALPSSSRGIIFWSICFQTLQTFFSHSQLILLTRLGNVCFQSLINSHEVTELSNDLRWKGP